MYTYILNLFSFVLLRSAILRRRIPGSEKLHPPKRMSARRRARLEEWGRLAGRTHSAIEREDYAFKEFEEKRDRHNRRARAYRDVVGPALAEAGAPIPYGAWSVELTEACLTSQIPYRLAGPFLLGFGFFNLFLLFLGIPFFTKVLPDLVYYMLLLVSAGLGWSGSLVLASEWSAQRYWSDDRDYDLWESAPLSVLRWLKPFKGNVKALCLIQESTWESLDGEKHYEKRPICWQISVVHDKFEYVLGYWRV